MNFWDEPDEGVNMTMLKKVQPNPLRSQMKLAAEQDHNIWADMLKDTRGKYEEAEASKMDLVSGFMKKKHLENKKIERQKEIIRLELLVDQQKSYI